MAKTKLSHEEVWKQATQVRAAVLVSLPYRYGFSSMASFIEALKGAEETADGAVREAMQSVLKRGVGGSKKVGKIGAEFEATASGSKNGRRLSSEQIAGIQADLQAGEKGAVVARKYGISYPTVHKYKTDLGLVTPRQESKKASKKAVKKASKKASKKPAKKAAKKAAKKGK